MEEVAGIIGMVFGMLGILFLPFLIIAGIIIFAQFKIFKKAGVEGWKCLIPIYNTWTQCEFVGLNTNWIWIILAAPFVGGFLDGLTSLGIFSLLASVVALYFSVLQAVSVAQSFGKDAGFGVGILLLPVVFYPILAFGNAEYVGARPMKDFVFKNNNNMTTSTPQQAAPVQNVNAQPQVASTKFCTNCGAPIEAGSNFCTSCGTQAN